MTAGGRYSRVLRSWRAVDQEALTDQDLLDTRRDLAMMDAAILPLVKRAEEADSPAWRARLREAFGDLDAAVKRKQHARVGPLMRDLNRLIEDGATADEVTANLLRHVDRRAGRAHRINELEVSEGLDDATFHRVLPRLKSLANASLIPRKLRIGACIPVIR